ncbi:MAG: SRPBCC family protein [Acidobacteriota bacterium]
MTTTMISAEPGKQDIVIIREFDAPRAAVFKAFTDPALIPLWWGPRSLTTTVEMLDLEPGGLWRFVQRDAERHEAAFRGVYHTIVPNEKLVYTFEFEGLPGHVALETVRFEDAGGKTRLTDQLIFQSAADRDGMLKAGMETAAKESMDFLEALLTSRRVPDSALSMSQDR